MDGLIYYDVHIIIQNDVIDHVLGIIDIEARKALIFFYIYGLLIHLTQYQKD